MRKPTKDSGSHGITTADAVGPEKLPASAWAFLLRKTTRAFNQRNIPASGTQRARGGNTKLYSFADLPLDYRRALAERLNSFRCPTFADLLLFTKKGAQFDQEIRTAEEPRYDDKALFSALTRAATALLAGFRILEARRGYKREDAKIQRAIAAAFPRRVTANGR